MIGGGIAAALLACQETNQAYREEEQRQRDESTRHNNFYFNHGFRDGCGSSSPRGYESASPNEFTTGMSL